MSSSYTPALSSLFASLSLSPASIAHAAVSNVDEHRAALAAAGRLDDARLVKNLFVKDKKKQLYLIVAASDATVSLGAVAKHLGVTGGPLRLESAEALQAVLGVAQGTIHAHFYMHLLLSFTC